MGQGLGACPAEQQRGRVTPVVRTWKVSTPGPRFCLHDLCVPGQGLTLGLSVHALPKILPGTFVSEILLVPCTLGKTGGLMGHEVLVLGSWGRGSGPGEPPSLLSPSPPPACPFLHLRNEGGL